MASAAGGMHSVAASRAHSDAFGPSASQYGGPGAVAPPPVVAKKKPSVNYFLVPVFVLQVVGLACLVALFYYLRFESLFPYRKREFWCYDRKLMYRNLDWDEYVYISRGLLYAICFSVPIIVIIVGEVMFWLFSTKPRKAVYANCRECKVHLITRRILRFVAVFLFGALIVCIFTDFIKLLTGYQRPYFLTVCDIQDYSKCREAFQFSAQPISLLREELEILDTDPISVCSDEARQAYSADVFREAWTSFPSLYATLSSFSMIFASLYIHYMISLRGAPLLRPFLIALLIAFAILASFSRINGYKNHWRDIWVGWIIGAIAAFYLCFAVLRFQEVYHVYVERQTVVEEQRLPPFFNWFRLPRVRAPSRDYSVYSAEESPVPERKTRQRDQNRTYEVTTTTESFHRTIHPPTQQGVSQGPGLPPCRRFGPAHAQWNQLLIGGNCGHAH